MNKLLRLFGKKDINEPFSTVLRLMSDTPCRFDVEHDFPCLKVRDRQTGFEMRIPDTSRVLTEGAATGDECRALLSAAKKIIQDRDNAWLAAKYTAVRKEICRNYGPDIIAPILSMISSLRTINDKR